MRGARSATRGVTGRDAPKEVHSTRLSTTFPGPVLDRSTMTSIRTADRPDAAAPAHMLETTNKRRLVGRRPALPGVAHQLLRPRDDLVRAAAHLARPASRARSQRRPALCVLLVVYADADSDGRARRSREPAVAVAARVHAVVGIAGADRVRHGLGTLIAFRVLLGVGEAIYLPGGSRS